MGSIIGRGRDKNEVTQTQLAANSAADRNRANHTGAQSAATIADFTEAVQDAVAQLFGTGNAAVSYTYDDANNSLIISVAQPGDPELIRDTIGAAVIGLGLIDVAVNDAGDTITLSTRATQNSTDVQLRDRGTHTGTQSAATITGLATVARTGSWNDLTDKPPGGSTALLTVQEEGLPLPHREKLNFIGAAVTATDNPSTESTDVTVTWPSLAGYVNFGFNQTELVVGPLDARYLTPEGYLRLQTYQLNRISRIHADAVSHTDFLLPPITLDDVGKTMIFINSHVLANNGNSTVPARNLYHISGLTGATSLYKTLAPRQRVTLYVNSRRSGSTMYATWNVFMDGSPDPHTHLSADIIDLVEKVQDTVGAMFGGTQAVYNDTDGTITLNIPTQTPEDAESIRDLIGAAMQGAGLIDVTTNDELDTITIATRATQNRPDAELLALENATGQLQGIQLAPVSVDFSHLTTEVQNALSVNGIPDWINGKNDYPVGAVVKTLDGVFFKHFHDPSINFTDFPVFRSETWTNLAQSPVEIWRRGILYQPGHFARHAGDLYMATDTSYSNPDGSTDEIPGTVSWWLRVADADGTLTISDGSITMQKLAVAVQTLINSKVDATVLAGYAPLNHGQPASTITDFSAEVGKIITTYDTQIKGGVPAAGDTLQKLYNLVLGATAEQVVATIAVRNAFVVPRLPYNVFVTDDGDTRWALYRATTTGANASYVKLSDPDLLNAIMSASQIAAAYESHPDRFAFTGALRDKLNSFDPTLYAPKTITGEVTGYLGLATNLWAAVRELWAKFSGYETKEQAEAKYALKGEAGGVGSLVIPAIAYTATYSPAYPSEPDENVLLAPIHITSRDLDKNAAGIEYEVRRKVSGTWQAGSRLTSYEAYNRALLAIPLADFAARTVKGLYWVEPVDSTLHATVIVVEAAGAEDTALPPVLFEDTIADPTSVFHTENGKQMGLSYTLAADVASSSLTFVLKHAYGVTGYLVDNRTTWGQGGAYAHVNFREANTRMWVNGTEQVGDGNPINNLADNTIMVVHLQFDRTLLASQAMTLFNAWNLSDEGMGGYSRVGLVRHYAGALTAAQIASHANPAIGNTLLFPEPSRLLAGYELNNQPAEGTGTYTVADISGNNRTATVTGW